MADAAREMPPESLQGDANVEKIFSVNFPLTTLSNDDLQELDMLIWKKDGVETSDNKSDLPGSDAEELSGGESDFVPNSDSSSDFSDESEASILFLPKTKSIQKQKKGRIKLRKMATMKRSEIDAGKKRDVSTTSKREPLVRKRSKPARPCPYCGKFKSKLTRHLKTMHKSEEEVFRALTLPKKQQVNEFELLRKEGIFKHNMKILKDEKPLICEWGHVKDGLKMCYNCKAFIRRKYFFKHSKTCRQKYGGEFTKGLSVDLVDESECIEFTDLLSRFNDDEAGKICKQNSVIRLIGKAQFNKHKRKKDKATEARRATMSKMRTLANLYIEFLKCSKSVGVEKMFIRSNFSALEEAIQNMTSHKDGSLKAGLKVCIGNLLKLCAKVLKGSYLIADDDAAAESVDKFLAVLTLKWTSIFGDAEYQILKSRNENLREPVKLPDEAAVKQVRDYTVRRLDQLLDDQYQIICPEYFISIRDLTVSRLTLFNARRGGEPSRLRVKDWADAKDEKWVDPQRKAKMIGKEKSLLETFKVIYQGGKGTNHLVPVLVPPDCVAALEFLHEKSNREKCQVNPMNNFLFPSTKMSMDHASGWHCVKRVADAAGASTHITATSMRHRASTLYAQLDIPEDQRKAFFSHMGHSATMNKDVYQCPLGIQEVTKVGDYFASIDGLDIKGDKNSAGAIQCTENGQPLSTMIDPSESDIARLQSGAMVASDETFEQSDEASSQNFKDVVNPFSELEAASPPKRCKTKKTSSGRQYVRWKEKDTVTLRSCFKAYIEETGEENKGSLPGYDEIRKFLENNDVLEDVHDMKNKVKVTHTKIFNERKRYREMYSKRLLVLTE